MVYTKKQLAAKKRREKELKDAIAEWAKGEDVKAKCLKTFGAVCIGHPTEKTFGGQKDQTITIKEADFEWLEKAGYVEEAK